MSRNNRRRSAEQAPRNYEFKRAMMEKGRSSATDRHKSVKDYRRKPKHIKKGWE